MDEQNNPTTPDGLPSSAQGYGAALRGARKSIFKHGPKGGPSAWCWVIITIVIFAGIFAVKIFSKVEKPDSNDKNVNVQQVQQVEVPDGKKYPACPANLEGLLTSALVEPTYIAAIGPLGWLSAGHTAPSDHNSFRIPMGDEVQVHAPADGWITRINYQWERLADGSLKSNGANIYYTICDGLILKISTLKELSPAIQTEVDKITEAEKSCEEGKFKDKSSVIHKLCDFETRISVKAGDLFGHVFEMDSMENFETWAYDYRNFNTNYDKTLKFYSLGGEDIGHSFCLFDLYDGELRSKYNNHFGRFDDYSKTFSQRVGEPVCGTHHQERKGTAQGTWYLDTANPLTIIHDDIDQRKGLMAISSPLRDEEQNVNFDIKHTGRIDREPSEVTADGKIYCYNVRNSRRDDPMGKVLIQMIDQSHLKAEYFSSGTCGGSESFGSSVKTLDR